MCPQRLVKMVVAIIWTTLTGLGSVAAWGQAACSLASTSQARVVQAGKAVELPTILADCKGAMIEQGDVVACVEDRRGRLLCRTFAAGDRISAQLLNASAGNHRWLDVVIALLKGDIEDKSAVDRGGPDIALPKGKVMFISGALELDFAEASLAGVERVLFTDVVTGKVVAQAAATRKTAVDVRLFVPGHTYAWTIRSRDQMLDETSGRFAVLDAKGQRPARDEAVRIHAQEGIGKAAQALMLAAWLSEHELPFDARQVLHSADFASQ